MKPMTDMRDLPPEQVYSIATNYAPVPWLRCRPPDAMMAIWNAPDREFPIEHKFIAVHSPRKFIIGRMSHTHKDMKHKTADQRASEFLKFMDEVIAKHRSEDCL